MMLKRDVFPAPFGPMSPLTPDASTRNETSERIRAPPNEMLTLSTRRSMALLRVLYGPGSAEQGRHPCAIAEQAVGQKHDDHDEQDPVDQRVIFQEPLPENLVDENEDHPPDDGTGERSDSPKDAHDNRFHGPGEVEDRLGTDIRDHRGVDRPGDADPESGQDEGADPGPRRVDPDPPRHQFVLFQGGCREADPRGGKDDPRSQLFIPRVNSHFGKITFVASRRASVVRAKLNPLRRSMGDITSARAALMKPPRSIPA